MIAGVVAAKVDRGACTDQFLQAFPKQARIGNDMWTLGSVNGDELTLIERPNSAEDDQVDYLITNHNNAYGKRVGLLEVATAHRAQAEADIALRIKEDEKNGRQTPSPVKEAFQRTINEQTTVIESLKRQMEQDQFNLQSLEGRKSDGTEYRHTINIREAQFFVSHLVVGE